LKNGIDKIGVDNYGLCWAQNLIFTRRWV